MRAMNPSAWSILNTLLFCMLIVSVSPLTHAATDIGKRIELAADHLLRMQLDSGLFVYEHDFLSSADSKSNNIVRQAGAAYALAEYYRHSQKLIIKRAVARALMAFSRRSITWKRGSLLTLDGTPRKAKAGATALAVLAKLLTGDETGELRNDRQLQAWIDGLLGLQQPDGGFAAKPGSRVQSAYSNGEVWLALATYVDRLGKHHNPALSSTLAKADRRFMEQYQAQPDIGFFHWGMMAAATRYKTTRDPAFTAFIAGQIRVFLEKLRPRVSRKSNSCYSVEGMLSGLEALRTAGGDEKLLHDIRRRVAREMKKNRQLQIVPEQQRIHFGKDHYLAVPALDRYAGAFLNGRYRPKIRVDATQHCLSAMIREQSLPSLR